MKYVIYLKSRANYHDVSTWSKELLPSDFTLKEIREVCNLLKIEGFALTNASGNKIVHLEWFK